MSIFGSAEGIDASVVFVAVATDVGVGNAVAATVAARVEVATAVGTAVGEAWLVAVRIATAVGAAAVVAVACGAGVFVAAVEAMLGVVEAWVAAIGEAALVVAAGATGGVDAVPHAARIRTASPSRESRIEKVHFMSKPLGCILGATRCPQTQDDCV
jgi:hypothetical protein